MAFYFFLKYQNNLGFQGIETQAIAGLTVHRLVIDKDFMMTSSYKPLFDAAFVSDDEDQRYSKVNAALAIAAYERTVLPNLAPFQQWLKGDNSAMTGETSVAAAKSAAVLAPMTSI